MTLRYVAPVVVYINPITPDLPFSATVAQYVEYQLNNAGGGVVFCSKSSAGRHKFLIQTISTRVTPNHEPFWTTALPQLT